MMIICVVFFMRRGSFGPWMMNNERNDSSSNQWSSALEIAKTRYAKGEISKEEYDQIKSDLS
jgi:putative membrane protein